MTANAWQVNQEQKQVLTIEKDWPSLQSSTEKEIKEKVKNPKPKKKDWKKVELNFGNPKRTKRKKDSPEQKELKKMILYQFEYYFSVENLVKDLYLRALMDENGFVDLENILLFNRLNQLLFAYADKYFKTMHAPSFIKDLVANRKIVEFNGNKVRVAEGWENWILPADFTAKFLKNTYSKPPIQNEVNEAEMSQNTTFVDQKFPGENGQGALSAGLNSEPVAKGIPTPPTSPFIELPMSAKIPPTIVEDEEGWSTVVNKKNRNHSTSSSKNFIEKETSKVVVETDADEDLFQFDENEDWASKPTFEVEVPYEHFVLESDFEDEELETITIVTQRGNEKETHQNLPPRKHATIPFVRAKAETDIADMINEGLFLYEKSIGKPKLTANDENVATNAVNGTPLKARTQQISLEKNDFKSPKRFVTGGLTAASPPVGWLVNENARFSKSVEKGGASFGGRSFGTSHRSAASSFGGRSFGKSFDKTGKSIDTATSSFKEFQPFQHPSYELLKENGFIQHKYTKYHSKAIRGILFLIRSKCKRNWAIPGNEHPFPILVPFSSGSF